MARILDRWSVIVPIVDEFKSVLRPELATLSLLHACDQKWSNDEWKKEQKRMRDAFQRKEPDGFVPSKMAGVYLWFDDDSRLFKVGCTVTRFDKRIYRCGNDGLPVRWIDVIVMGEKIAFLAPALEALLIDRLRPPGNKKRF